MKHDLNDYPPELVMLGRVIVGSAIVAILVAIGVGVAYGSPPSCPPGHVNIESCDGSGGNGGSEGAGDAISESVADAVSESVSGSESVSSAVSGNSGAVSSLNYEIPRTQVVVGLGGVAGAGNGTAPCTIIKPSWFGVRGAKSKMDPQCWTEYQIQAEHEREMDRLALELERERIALERNRIRLQEIELELCVTCANQK